MTTTAPDSTGLIRWASAQEVADVLGWRVESVWRAMRAGRLDARRFAGRRVAFRLDRDGMPVFLTPRAFVDPLADLAAA